MSLSEALSSALGASGAFILCLALAIALGLLLGRVQIRGIRLAESGVLFSSLALAQFGIAIPNDALPVLRDLALAVFVYAIGLQVGPGFVASFRAGGLRLNLLAAAVLLMGTVMAVGVSRFLVPHPAVGVFAGAFASTPALASGQVVIRQVLSPDPAREAAALSSAGLAYAVTYPFGTIAPVVLISVLRRLFRVRMDQERAALDAQGRSLHPPSMTVDFEVTQTPHARIRDLPASIRKGVVLSRILHKGIVSMPRATTVLEPGDVVRAVGDPRAVHGLVAALGRPSATDLSAIAGEVRRADLVVTRSAALRRTLRELDIRSRTGVTIAHINRAGVDLVPNRDSVLKFGDHVTVVGPEAGVRTVTQELGNEPQALNRTYLFPVFLGILLGVLVGAIPLRIPGVPAPLEIGLAGGALVVSIALSQLGSLGPVIWYMPVAANQIIRDAGLCIFLACVGFQTGPGLLERAAHEGVGVFLAGAAVTVVPLVFVACFARRVLRMNFITLSGWIAGTMGNTSALLLANEDAKSDAPALAYASVAPLCELLPIICAEVIALGYR